MLQSWSLSTRQEILDRLSHSDCEKERAVLANNGWPYVECKTCETDVSANCNYYIAFCYKAPAILTKLLLRDGDAFIKIDPPPFAILETNYTKLRWLQIRSTNAVRNGACRINNVFKRAKRTESR